MCEQVLLSVTKGQAEEVKALVTGAMREHVYELHRLTEVAYDHRKPEAEEERAELFYRRVVALWSSSLGTLYLTLGLGPPEDVPTLGDVLEE